MSLNNILRFGCFQVNVYIGIARPGLAGCVRRHFRQHAGSSGPSRPIHTRHTRRPRLALVTGNKKMHYSTSLFTTATESERVPFVMKPEFDFHKLFHEDNVVYLKESILKRKLRVDLNKIMYLWERVKDVEENMNFLQTRRESLKEEGKNFNRQKSASQEVKMQFRTEGKRIRENLKKATALYNSLSQELYLSVLQLPNILHPETPSEEEVKVIEVHGSKADTMPIKHVPYGIENGLLSINHDIVNPGMCYLHGKAAWLQMALLWWMSNALMDRGFMRFSSPDMYKPVALEAVCVDVTDPEQVFSVLTSESNLYLTGVSSAVFSGYYMMSVIENADLPQRSFSVGTHYDASKESQSFLGLPTIMQRSQIEISCLCHASSESDSVFHQTTDMLLDLYSQLPVQLRLVEVGTKDLLPSMYRKQAIQLLLPSTQEYYEVACVYNCTDYISRRLKIRYPADPTQRAAQSRKRVHAHTIHGTAVNVPVLLAVLLETCQTEDQNLAIPTVLTDFLPKIFSS
ncbi:serine--tRNA ligase-like [Anneissia japonica]|uniref:serine--tRNA ligase-like n=1 Tax=Anneissia japonica TaxID=1529436 RepID=UPI0014255028|nr:serine--tRNA ligase-like [Anneissia japonica]